MTKNNNYFETSDLGLGTALITYGFEMDALDRSEPSRVRFSFVRSPGLDEVVQKYWARSLTVEPLAFFTNIKLLKNRIYSR